MSQKIDTSNLLSKLLNTTQFAFVASIALHLLVYKYGLPKWMLQEQKYTLDNTIASIELSPTEVARLPNLETQGEVPDFNTSSIEGEVSSFAFPSSITPTPDTLPVPNLVPSNFNLQSFPFFPPVTTIELPPVGDLSPLPPPPLETLEAATSPTSIPELPPSVIAEPKPIQPSSNLPETKTEPKPTPEQIAAVRQQKLQRDIRDISSSLKKQEVGTTNEDARKNYLTWLGKVKTIEPEAIEIEGIYPRDACIRRLEGKSVYGVVVDSDNTVVALELIKAAKYPIFNQQANQDIRNQDFANNTGEAKPYRVTVNYQYNAEICPSLTLPSLRKKTETSTPETKPIPTPTPEEVETIPTPEETETNSTPEEVETNSTLEEVETAPTLEESETTSTSEETETNSTPEEPTPLPSLRERLQNAPLLDDNSLRDRLQQNPLPQEE